MMILLGVFLSIPFLRDDFALNVYRSIAATEQVGSHVATVRIRVHFLRQLYRDDCTDAARLAASDRAAGRVSAQVLGLRSCRAPAAGCRRSHAGRSIGVVTIARAWAGSGFVGAPRFRLAGQQEASPCP
jgi:hypothetical protein